jgi:hypothetical protein
VTDMANDRPVAPGVARPYVDEDEAPQVVGGLGIEVDPLGVGQSARVVVRDRYPAETRRSSSWTPAAGMWRQR